MIKIIILLLSFYFIKFPFLLSISLNLVRLSFHSIQIVVYAQKISAIRKKHDKKHQQKSVISRSKFNALAVNGEKQYLWATEKISRSGTRFLPQAPE